MTSIGVNTWRKKGTDLFDGIVNNAKTVDTKEDFLLNIFDDRTKEQDTQSNYFQSGRDFVDVASLPV